MKNINQDNFKEEVLQAEGPVLVDVWAPWCGPCNAMMPRLEEISKECNVMKLNLDENMDLCKQYNVSAIPTFLFFKNGELVERRMGIQNSNELKSIMNNLIDPE